MIMMTFPRDFPSPACLGIEGTAVTEHLGDSRRTSPRNMGFVASFGVQYNTSQSYHTLVTSARRNG